MSKLSNLSLDEKFIDIYTKLCKLEKRELPSFLIVKKLEWYRQGIFYGQYKNPDISFYFESFNLTIEHLKEFEFFDQISYGQEKNDTDIYSRKTIKTFIIEDKKLIKYYYNLAIQISIMFLELNVTKVKYYNDPLFNINQNMLKKIGT